MAFATPFDPLAHTHTSFLFFRFAFSALFSGEFAFPGVWRSRDANGMGVK
jgi:hypothetical protein